ncbi:hypothetical protein BC567DRAFT_265588 [Phyllosticta citribraziliensis]
MSRVDTIAGKMLREALLLDNLKMVTEILVHSKQDVVNERIFEESHDQELREWCLRLPIECYGAQTETIKLKAIGIDTISLEYSPVDPFNRDQCIAEAKEVLHHLSESGPERISPFLLFSVSTIAGDSKTVDSNSHTAFMKRVAKGSKGHEALAIAAQLSHLDVVRALLNAGAPPNQEIECSTAICPPIFWATKHGHLKMVNLLLQSGARTERPHCLHGSPGKGSRHELYNQSISALPTVLQLALAQKDDSMAKTLLLHGADPEPAQINGSTGPFRHLHQKKILRIRLGNHRGDVYSSKLLSLLRKAQRWDRPLKVASFCEFLGAHVQPEGIRLRLDHGKPGTLSFLQAAAWKWDVPMMKKSLEKRGNINCVNSEGLTPLHMLFLNPWRFHSNSHSFKELQKALTFMVDNGAKFNSLKTPAPLILVIADAISHMEPQDGMELFDFLVNQGLTCDDPRALEKALKTASKLSDPENLSTSTADISRIPAMNSAPNNPQTGPTKPPVGPAKVNVGPKHGVDVQTGGPKPTGVKVGAKNGVDVNVGGKKPVGVKVGWKGVHVNVDGKKIM